MFVIESHDRKQFYLYGYCKEPFPDMKLKNFKVRTSGIVYCHPTIHSMEMEGEKKYFHEDVHKTMIPFHEFISHNVINQVVQQDQNEGVFELINDLAQENIRDRPIFVDDDTVMPLYHFPFALLEDWEEANRLVGGGPIDIKNITGNYLASKVHEYTRLYPGRIMSSSFGGKRERISVRELISRYYEPSLEKDQLQLESHLLSWLKEKMEERLDSCEYAMWYADNQEAIKSIHEPH